MVLRRPSSDFIEPCLPSRVARPPSGPLVAAIDTSLQLAIGHCPAQTRRSDRRGCAGAATSGAGQGRDRNWKTRPTLRRPGRAPVPPATQRKWANAARVGGWSCVSLRRLLRVGGWRDAVADAVGQRVEFRRAAATAADQRFLALAEGSRFPLLGKALRSALASTICVTM
jgi:hypothetical protein